MTTATPPPTTPPTVAHDSSTCRLGSDGGKCEMCQFAEDVQQGRFRLVAIGSIKGVDYVDRSAAAIRARRAALLERADASSPTEGAVALAEAYLDATDWWQQLASNALQDAAVLELAEEIESAVDSYLQGQWKE